MLAILLVFALFIHASGLVINHSTIALCANLSQLVIVSLKIAVTCSIGDINQHLACSYFHVRDMMSSEFLSIFAPCMK